MARRNEFLQQLNRLRIERRPEACLGCGFEHDCSLHGCAVMREVKARIEAPEVEKPRAATPCWPGMSAGGEK